MIIKWCPLKNNIFFSFRSHKKDDIILTVLFYSIQSLITQELAANPQVSAYLQFASSINGAAPVNNFNVE